MSIISDELRAYFFNIRMTQQEIADRLGTTKQTVSKYFTGKSKFGKRQAERWAQEFGLSKTFLLTGEGDIIPQQDKENSIESVADTIRLLTQLIDEKNKLIAMLKDENEKLRKENNDLKNQPQ